MFLHFIVLGYVLNHFSKDATLAPLSIPKYSRWPPRWPPKHKNCYIFLISEAMTMILMSTHRFVGSRNPFIMIIIQYNNYINNKIAFINNWYCINTKTAISAYWVKLS